MAKELLTDGQAVVGALRVKHGLALQELTESFAASAFTDDNGVNGHAHFSGSLPVGAIVLGGKVVVTRGFTGDTSAVLIVGDGAGSPDNDRFNTGTIDIFAAAAAGIDLGLPSGAVYQAVACTPKLMVVSATDFSNVLAASPNGLITVSLYYINTTAA